MGITVGSGKIYSEKAEFDLPDQSGTLATEEYVDDNAGGGGISSIVAGSGIAVDATDPANPEVSATGGVVIPATSYDNNTDAEAALGVGELYKSSTLINGSPIILITV